MPVPVSDRPTYVSQSWFFQVHLDSYVAADLWMGNSAKFSQHIGELIKLINIMYVPKVFY